MIPHDASVALIITSFNSAQYISNAIESALKQTRKASEILVVDNGSTDETVSIAQQYPINVLVNPDSGVGASRNLGLSQTKSELIKFLDADDLLLENAIDSLLDEFAAVECDLVYGQMSNFINPFMNKTSIDKTSKPIASPVALTSLLTRESITRYGGFMDDQYSWMSWYLASKRAGLRVAQIHQVVGLRRIHDGNFSKNAEYWKGIISILRDSSK